MRRGLVLFVVLFFFSCLQKEIVTIEKGELRLLPDNEFRFIPSDRILFREVTGTYFPLSKSKVYLESSYCEDSIKKVIVHSSQNFESDSVLFTVESISTNAYPLPFVLIEIYNRSDTITRSPSNALIDKQSVQSFSINILGKRSDCFRYNNSDSITIGFDYLHPLEFNSYTFFKDTIDLKQRSAE